jgi:predicted Zn-dependent protease
MRIEWIEQYLAEAEQLIMTNHVDRGLKLMNELLYDEPGYGYLHNYLGWAYLYYTNDTTRAELHLMMAVKFNEEYPAPYLHLGTLYNRMGRYTDALTYLKRGLTKPNANRQVFFQSMAQAYEMKREFGNAIQAYKEALTHSVGYESETLMQSITRCRKKRLVLFFSF